MIILGVSAYYHDSAAALIIDGEVVAAAQEERFTRIKHDAAFPTNAIQYCLKQAGITAAQLDHVAFYDKPILKFDRLIETYLAFAPRGFSSFLKAMPLWFKEKLFQRSMLIKSLNGIDDRVNWNTRLLFSEHHISHAASAYYASPFDKAIVLTMDGVGEWTTTSVCVGDGRDLRLLKEIHFPHSLGLLYSAFTYYTGFKVNSGEYKVMGLAPYGRPRFKDIILEKVVDLKDDGTFRLDQQYFDYCTGLRMTNKRFEELFGIPTRQSEDELTQDHMDLAASIQAVTEEIVLRIIKSIVEETGIRDVCLAGGVALNCVANGKVINAGLARRLWVQPAAGDAGGAYGAAMVAYHMYCRKDRSPMAKGEIDRMKGSYLGPEFTQQDIEAELRKIGARFKVLTEDQLIEVCAQGLESEKAIGWFQGRMEFGPRALGARSILGDPRSPRTQSVLNLKVKYRESFRPFAPSVLREDLKEWFALDEDSPYMLVVAGVAKKRQKAMTSEQEKLFGIAKLNVPRSEIPAVTHVDYSARIQTVHKVTNPRYHKLISEFKARTGCPVVVNTSFNVRGEPIVCTPSDAFRCFMGTELDMLAVGNCLLIKEEQDPAFALDYKNRFELD